MVVLVFCCSSGFSANVSVRILPNGEQGKWREPIETREDTIMDTIKRTLLIMVAMLAASLPVFAQAGGAGAEMQQKLAAVKQSVGENQQKLHQYQWKETTQLTLKGDPKPPSNQLASMVRMERYRRRR